MKVKNIAFSGFMAAILMGATGANAAIQVASTDYVDAKSASVASATITAEMAADGSIGSAIADAKSAGTAAQGAVETLEGVVSNLSATVDTKAAASDLTALTQTVEKLGDTYATDAELASEKAALQEQIAGVVAGDMKDALAAYATTEYTNAELAKKADKSVVDTIVTSLGDTGDVTAKISAAQTKADQAYELAGTKADQTALEGVASRVQTLEDTEYFTKDAADALYADIATEQTAADAAAQAAANATEIAGVKATANAALPAATYNKFVAENAALNSGITETLVGQITTNQNAITNINDSAVMKSNITAEKVSAYDAVTTAVNDTTSGLSATKTIADGAAAQAETNKGDIANINTALTTKITMPAVCEKTTCVLTVDSKTKQPAWAPLFTESDVVTSTNNPA